PRFSYRGMMLDVARTFIPIDRVKLYIDWLSHHKINKFLFILFHINMPPICSNKYNGKKPLLYYHIFTK
ncbi:MAG: family 20 glycosylhydrolase, partial [Lachnospiraceae bacterium]|nr:family 20 glycosylhydrolase [Lachnospiraceae bacterium]